MVKAKPKSAKISNSSFKKSVREKAEKIASKETETKQFDITKHALVPKHRVLPEKEAEQLLKVYNISVHQLPLIKNRDPIIQAIGAKVGDIIEIIRDGPTKSYLFYRRVIE